MPDELTLPHTVALMLFVVAVIAGHRYRRVWKQKGSRREAWIYGLIAAVGLAAAALIPMRGA
ncbi:MAG: hypothetical protein AAGI27_07455 [Pseudomonadota bacterium]